MKIWCSGCRRLRHEMILLVWSTLLLCTLLPTGLGLVLMTPVSTFPHHPSQIGCFRCTNHQQGISVVRLNDFRPRSFESARVLHVATTGTSTDSTQPEEEEYNSDTYDRAAEDRDDAIEAPPPTASNQRLKMRRRRKEESPTVDAKVITTTPPVVTIPIVDVRNLVGDSTKSTGTAVADDDTSQPPNFSNSLPRQGIKIEANAASTTTTTTTYDPLEQLLRDVQEMRAMTTTGTNSGTTGSSPTERPENGNDTSQGSAFQRITDNLSFSKVISTIVIFDFFVVLIFFFWFLLGIAASTIVKDDTIQIAFNSNFQSLVQPALGILMIASISDAVFKENGE